MTTRSVTDLFDDTKPPQTGYVVFGIGRDVPSVIHATREEAVREVERLVLGGGAQRYIVCQVTDTVCRTVLANRRSLTDETNVTSWMEADGPEDDGWIPHDGGPCPVSVEKKVIIRYGDNKEVRVPYPAYRYGWSLKGPSTKIIAYKVVS